MCFVMSLGNTSTLQHLRKAITVTHAERTNLTRSVELALHKMTAEYHCEEDSVPIHSQCIKPVPVGNNFTVEAMRVLCLNHVPILLPVMSNSTSFINMLGILVQRLAVRKIDLAFLIDDDKCIVFDEIDSATYHECAQIPSQVICMEETKKTRCPPAYFQCSNGECIADKFVCDTKPDCQRGEEDRCEGICSTSFAADTKYCRHVCHPANCTCSHVLYQCHSGGCIHSSTVCDGQHDCADVTDENMCHAELNTLPAEHRSHFRNEEMSLVGDFFPDFVSGSDEVQYASLLSYPSNHTSTLCGTFSMPCIQGHPNAFR